MVMVNKFVMGYSTAGTFGGMMLDCCIDCWGITIFGFGYQLT